MTGNRDTKTEAKNRDKNFINAKRRIDNALAASEIDQAQYQKELAELKKKYAGSGTNALKS